MFQTLTLKTEEDCALARQSQNYIDRHRLILDGTPELSASSLLVPLRTPDSQAVMLKTVRPNHVELDAPVFYGMYKGHGAVHLLDQEDNLHLLERAVSSHQPLWEMTVNGQEQEATLIICSVAKKLFEADWSHLKPGDLKPYEARNASIRTRLQENAVPSVMVEAFKAALDILPQLANTYQPRPGHYDMHPWNIVHDHARGWLAIDPQGSMGPAPAALANTLTTPCNPAYGIGPDFVLNRPRMQRRLALIAETMSWDKGDLTHCVFLHATQVASRRLHVKEMSKVGYDYWMAAATLAADIGDIRFGQKNRVFTGDGLKPA